MVFYLLTLLQQLQKTAKGRKKGKRTMLNRIKSRLF